MSYLTLSIDLFWNAGRTSNSVQGHVKTVFWKTLRSTGFLEATDVWGKDALFSVFAAYLR